MTLTAADTEAFVENISSFRWPMRLTRWRLLISVQPMAVLTLMIDRPCFKTGKNGFFEMIAGFKAIFAPLKIIIAPAKTISAPADGAFARSKIIFASATMAFAPADEASAPANVISAGAKITFDALEMAFACLKTVWTTAKMGLSSGHTFRWLVSPDITLNADDASGNCRPRLELGRNRLTAIPGLQSIVVN